MRHKSSTPKKFFSFKLSLGNKNSKIVIYVPKIAFSKKDPSLYLPPSLRERKIPAGKTKQHHKVIIILPRTSLNGLFLSLSLSLAIKQEKNSFQDHLFLTRIFFWLTCLTRLKRKKILQPFLKNQYFFITFHIRPVFQMFYTKNRLKGGITDVGTPHKFINWKIVKLIVA